MMILFESLVGELHFLTEQDLSSSELPIRSRNFFLLVTFTYLTRYSASRYIYITFISYTYTSITVMSPRITFEVEGYECSRCGHRWIPRTKTDTEPTICPKCKSPYWDKPRMSVGKLQGGKLQGGKLKGGKLG
jgi:DNA-directed RNA polymerase subunit RPC12/RpoP